MEKHWHMLGSRVGAPMAARAYSGFHLELQSSNEVQMKRTIRVELPFRNEPPHLPRLPTPK